MAPLGKSSFHIASATGVCRATGRTLAVGEAYVAALVEPQESDDLEREDYSAEAWDAGARPGAGRRLFGFWRATVPEPNATRKLLADDDSLMDLFEQLGEEADARKVAFRFVLALLLVRRRVLAVEGTRRDAILVRQRGVERPPKGPPLIEVIDPALDDETVAAVIEQMRAITGDEPAAETAAGGKGG
jgi:hypothetical protein